ncbi:MAG: LuxR C-terminal-related transcriptional regulator [Desulfatitalea sp.]
MKIPKPIVEELECEINRLKIVLSQKDKLIKKLKTSPLQPKRSKAAPPSLKDGDLYRILFDLNPVAAVISTLKEGFILKANSAFFQATGYQENEVAGQSSLDLCLWPDPSYRKHLTLLLKEKKKLSSITLKVRLKSGEVNDFLGNACMVEFEGRPCLLSLFVDTARQKVLEAALIEKESKLTALACHLQELDTTVRVLGDVWGREKTAIDARIKSTLNASVFPFIEKIKASKCVGDMHTYLKIIEDNLKEMNPVFTDSIVDANGDFTPSEMHVIQLIKQGKSSKEISDLLNLSTKAISFHRSNIRKKLGLVNKKLNLMTYLRGQSLLR